MASAAVAGEDLGEPVFKRNGSIIYRKITGYRRIRIRDSLRWVWKANFEWSKDGSKLENGLAIKVQLPFSETTEVVNIELEAKEDKISYGNSTLAPEVFSYLNIDGCFSVKNDDESDDEDEPPPKRQKIVIVPTKEFPLVSNSSDDDEDDDDKSQKKKPEKQQVVWNFTEEFKKSSYVKFLALQEIEKYLTRENDYSLFLDLRQDNFNVHYDKLNERAQARARALFSKNRRGEPIFFNNINKYHDVINSSLQIYDVFGSASQEYGSNDPMGMKNELMFGKMFNVRRGNDIDKINKDMNYMRFMYFVLENFLNAEDQTVITFADKVMSLKGGVHKEGYHESQCNPYFGIDDIEPTDKVEATIDTQWLYYALCSKKFPDFQAISFDELQQFDFNANINDDWVDTWKKCSALLQDVLKKEYEKPMKKDRWNENKKGKEEKNLHTHLARPNSNATEVVTYNFKTMFDIVHKITSMLGKKESYDYMISSLVYMSGTKRNKEWAKKFKKSVKEYADVQQMLKARRYILGSLIHMKNKKKKVTISNGDNLFSTGPLIEDVTNKFTQFVYKTRKSLGLGESLGESVAEFDKYRQNVRNHFMTVPNDQSIKCCKALEFYLCDKEMTSEPMKGIVKRIKKNKDKIRSSDFKTLSDVITDEYLIWRSSDKPSAANTIRSEEIYVFHSSFKRPLLKNYRRKFSYENFERSVLEKDLDFNFGEKNIFMYNGNGGSTITWEDLKNAKRVAFKRDEGRFTEVFCAFVKDTTFYVARVIIDNNVNDGIGSIIQKCNINSGVSANIKIEENTQRVEIDNDGRLNVGVLRYEMIKPTTKDEMIAFKKCFRFENYYYFREVNGQIELKTHENSNEDNFLRAYVYNEREMQMLSFFEIGIDVRWNDWKNIQKKFDDNLLLAKNWFIKDDYGYYIVSDFMSRQANDYKTVVFRSPGMPVREEMTLKYNYNKYDTLMKVGKDRYVSIKYAKKIEEKSKEHVGMVPITKRSKMNDYDNKITMFYDRGIQNKELNPQKETPMFIFPTNKPKTIKINEFYPNLGFVVCSDSDFHVITDNRKSDTVDEYDNMVTSLQDLSLRF